MTLKVEMAMTSYRKKLVAGIIPAVLIVLFFLFSVESWFIGRIQKSISATHEDVERKEAHFESADYVAAIQEYERALESYPNWDITRDALRRAHPILGTNAPHVSDFLISLNGWDYENARRHAEKVGDEKLRQALLKKLAEAQSEAKD